MDNVTNNMVIVAEIFSSYGLKTEYTEPNNVNIVVNTHADADCFKLANWEVMQMGLHKKVGISRIRREP